MKPVPKETVKLKRVVWGEKDSRALRGILDRRNIAVVGTHVFFYDNTSMDVYGGRESRKGAQKREAYNDRIVALFSSKKDWKNAVFVLEDNTHAPAVANLIFERKGGRFELSNPAFFSDDGSILQEAGSAANKKEGGFEPLKKMLSECDGVLVIGVCLGSCVSQTVRDIKTMAKTMGRDIPVYLNKSMTRLGFSWEGEVSMSKAYWLADRVIGATMGATSWEEEF